jgi:hypothetical protein
MKKIITSLFLVFQFCFNWNVSASEYKLWYRQPAEQWSEALPLGNGRMGVMVFGGIRTERFQLSEETLWSGKPEPKILTPDIKQQREKIMKHLFADELQEAGELMKKLDRTKYTGKDGIVIDGVTQQEHTFETMGNLWLFNDYPDFPAKFYYRDLDLNTAISSVKYTINGVNYVRESFCSFPHKIAVIRISADSAGQVSFNVLLNRPEDMNESWSDLMTAGSLVAPYPVKVAGVSDCEISMTGQASGDGLDFQTNVRVVAKGGITSVRDARIYCSGADEAVILIGSLTSFYGYPDMGEELSGRFNKAISDGFEKVKQTHIDDYSALYGGFDVTLGKSDASKLPTDMRLRRLRKEVLDPRIESHGDYDPEFAALFWQYCRYLCISSCREGTLPASLQFWNNSLVPPWYGRFTTNVNLQENFWGVETTNLSGLHSSLFDMVFPFLPAAREVARKSYGCKGGVFPGRGVSIYGPEYIYDSWNDGGAWMGQHFWEHFLFTGDTIFLKEKAYPFMKEMAIFYLDYLREDPEGYLVTGPSHSPENSFYYKGYRGGIDYGITMTCAIIHEIFTNTIAAAELLDTDLGFRNEMYAARERLMPYRIGRYGIQEWRRDYDEVTPGHRHISHLYGVYPGTEITREGTPELYEAAIRSFTRRLDNGGYWTSWSCSMGIGLAARLHQKENAHRLVKLLMKEQLMGNMFAVHSRDNSIYDVFSMDGNLGFIGGMSEIFLQSHAGFVELLPSLPDCWMEGSIKGMCARGGYILDLEWKDGKLIKVSILSKNGGLLKLKYRSQIWELWTEPGKKY